MPNFSDSYIARVEQLLSDRIEAILRPAMADLIVQVLPPSKNEATVKPRITVAYMDSKFNDAELDFVWQTETMRVEIMIESKGLRGTAQSAYSLANAVQVALLGYRGGDIQRVRMSEQMLPNSAKSDGVWDMRLFIECDRLATYYEPENTDALIQRVSLIFTTPDGVDDTVEIPES
jgi:Gp37 protein